MKNVLIINQYAANKGDRAVLFAMVSELLKHGVNISVSTHKPSLWQNYDFYSENNVKFIPWGWDFETNLGKSFYGNLFCKMLIKLKKYTYTINRQLFLLSKKIPFYIFRLLMNQQFYQALQKTDIVISTGGHHVTTLLARDAISAQLYDLSLAIFSGRPTYIWSQSIGPLDFFNKQNENFVYKVLNKCKGIYLRDQQSLQFFQNNGEHIHKTYESVFLLNNIFTDYILPSKRENVFGISIYSTKNRTKEERLEYVQTLANLVNYVTKQKIKVKFFPMEIKSSEPDDRPMIQEILENVDNQSFCSVVDEDLQTTEHLVEVSKCRYFLGHKTHSIIFALTSGTPLIALAYHPKSTDFMRQFSLEDYAISDDDLETGLLIELFEKLKENVDKVGAISFSRSREMSDQIRLDLSTIIS
jgi:colanic acid/amylovoran biosynthesis protein